MKNSNGNVIKTCTTNDAFLSSSTLEGGSRVRVFKETSQTRPPSARTLRNILGKRGEERKRERGRKKGKEHRRRRRLEDTKREMLIHGRCVSSSFVSYLNDPLTISFILHGEHLIPDTLVCSRFRDELKRNLRACSCLTYVELFACANWFILVQTPFSLSLSLSCRRSISLWAGGLEKAD